MSANHLRRRLSPTRNNRLRFCDVLNWRPQVREAGPRVALISERLMRDRGTIIAVGIVLLAFVIAGLGYLLLTVQQDRQVAMVEAEMARDEAQEVRDPIEQGNHLNDADRLRNSLLQGVDYLIAKHSPDSTWKSDQYA